MDQMGAENVTYFTDLLKTSSGLDDSFLIHNDGFNADGVLSSQAPTMTSEIPAQNEPSVKSRHRSTNYSIQEDVLLVSAWLNVGLDPVKGNDQKSCQYWARIAEHYHKNKTFETNRDASSLQHRWSAIQAAVNKFCGYYEQILNRPQSGETEQDKGSFSNLEILHLYSKVGTLMNWWSPLPAEFFSKLKSLGSHSGVFRSGFLQNLPHLEELVLYGFEKEVFVHEGISSGQIQAVGTLLPRLKCLWVYDMPELMHLGKENCQSVIPNLEFLDVCKCEKLKNLRSSAISFQNLKTLKVEKCHGLEYLTTYSIAQSLTQLEEMEVKDCQGLIEIVASNQDDDDAVNEILFMRLRRLKLYGLPSLQGFCSGKCIVNIPFLDTLTVTECLIELKISPDKVLLSNSKPERLKLIEEEAKDHDKPEGSDTTGTQAT